MSEDAPNRGATRARTSREPSNGAVLTPSGSGNATCNVRCSTFPPARAAPSGMIDLLRATRGLSAVDAYTPCSVRGDLRISEIVGRPNRVVSFCFPRCPRPPRGSPAARAISDAPFSIAPGQTLAPSALRDVGDGHRVAL